MSTNTTRLGLVQPAGSDGPVSLRTSIDTNATTLDNAVLVTEGTLASRPVASTVEHDHIYRTTDTGQWFVSDGTNWSIVLAAGAWTSLTPGFASGISAGSPGFAPSYRVEGDVGRFKGVIQNTSGGTITNSAPLFSLASHPSSTVTVSFKTTSVGPISAYINALGFCSIAYTPTTIANNALIYLDDATFTLS